MKKRRSVAPAFPAGAFPGFAGPDRLADLGLRLIYAENRLLHGADYLVHEARYCRYHFIPPLPDAGALGVIIYG